VRTTPPGEVTGTIEVTRVNAHGTCADLAAVSLQVAAPVERFGFLVRHVSGELPGKLMLPTVPVRFYGDWLQFRFYSEDTNGFDIELEISAVDLNGNVGAPTLFEVSEGAGCSSSPRSSSTSQLVVLASLMLMRRRARRRRSRPTTLQ
jgi:hypothetical protein